VRRQKAIPDLSFVALIQHQVPHARPAYNLPRWKGTQNPYTEAMVGPMSQVAFQVGEGPGFVPCSAELGHILRVRVHPPEVRQVGGR
jgi:hypothetical protein